MNRLGGSARDRAPIRLDVAKVHIPLSTVIAAWAGRRLWAGLVWVVRRPLLIVTSVLAVLVCRFIAAHGPGPLIAAAGTATGTLAGWWWVARASFTRHVTCGDPVHLAHTANHDTDSDPTWPEAAA